MHEIIPGVWHWTARRESIGADVHSYYLREERIVIDPMLPPERPDWFAPEHAFLTCRHHNRDAWELGATVWVHANGAHELEGRGEFRTYEWGDTLPGGALAVEVDAISPDETALFLPGHCALAIADAAVDWPGKDGLSFVPDEFMDDPERTKDGIRAAFRRISDELDFEHLLLAHGAPRVGTGKEELRAFAG